MGHPTTTANPARLPSWVRRADRALAQAVKQARVIAAATPRNHRAELARLEAELEAGQSPVPRFQHLPPRHDLAGLRHALDELAAGLDAEGPLGRIYAERARELELEAAICSSVGSGELPTLARRRFAAPPDLLHDATEMAEAWLAEELSAPADGDGEALRSDDASDPRSLVSALMAEVSRRSLPFRVITSPHLSALAATGDGVLIVASDRSVTEQDVRRTVLHEIEGHAEPATRAAASPLGIFALGTARGSDDQEGRALCLEAEGGFQTPLRRRELALRHLAALSVWDGATFADTAQVLLARGAPASDAARIAARVHRGGGLARESVYLPALLCVERARAADARLDRVLAAGRVSVEAAEVLRPWVDGQSLRPSRPSPDPKA